MKKLLTIQDLYNFCADNNFSHFDSEESGQELIIQSFGIVEFDDNSSKGLMPVKLKACHTELNANNSFISNETMENNLMTIKNRPILGNVIQLDDGSYDFHAHDYEIIDDPYNKGEKRIDYKERAIGIIPESCNAQLVYDKNMDKTYVEVDGLIFEDYSNLALDIIKEKKTLKVSVELAVTKLSYNSKKKYMEIEDFYFNGVTCLGRKKDGTEIKEGMIGSKLTIKDFSEESNSISNYNNTNIQNELVEILDKLNTTLSNFHKKNSYQKGGQGTLKLDELLEKYNKSIEDLDFDYTELSDEELEHKLAELFEDKADKEKSEDEESKDEEESKDKEDEDESNEDESNEDESNEDESNEDESNEESNDKEESNEDEGSEEAEESKDEEKKPKKKKLSLNEDGTYDLSFELSHDDIRASLYELILPYEQIDDKCYIIESVYADHFIMQTWDSKTVYGQKYIVENDAVRLVGERYSLHIEYLTDNELAELEEMRANYKSLKEFKETTEAKDLRSKKEQLLSSEEYSILSKNEDFISLHENMDDYSLQELSDKADLIFAKHVKSSKHFSLNTSKKEKSSNNNYVSFCSNNKPEKNSFLDGLLNLNK